MVMMVGIFEMAVLTGFMSVIVCCVALGFADVAASGAMGLFGGLIATMFFATPNHPFNCFPTVWLFICGLAMIIIILYLSRG